MFCIGLSYTIKFWSCMKKLQNNTSLFYFRNPWFYTLKIFRLSHNCSVRQPPVSIYQLPLPSLVTLLELLMQNAQLILELSYNVHSGSSNQTKSALIIKVSEDIFNVFFCDFDHELKSIKFDCLGRTPNCLKYIPGHEQLLMHCREYKYLSLFSMIFSLTWLEICFYHSYLMPNMWQHCLS